MTTLPLCGFNAIQLKEELSPSQRRGFYFRCTVSAPSRRVCGLGHVRLLGCGAAILDTMSNIGEQPAFPWAIPASIPEHPRMGADGMTYREWLAGMALQGKLANPHYSENAQRTGVSPEDFIEALAKHSVRVTDALIAELSKPHAQLDP